MKKIFMAVMVICVAAAGNGMMAYCQGDSYDDSSIEQSESQMSENLDSEIGSDRAQAEANVEQVDSSMDISGN